jgi:hypothetical protein
MVSCRSYVAPPDVYQGEKRVSLKPPKPTPMSRVKISLKVSNPKITCGKRKLTANQITSRHLFGYFSSVRCQVNAAKRLIRKDHHLKLIVKRDNSLSLLVLSTVTDDWHSMTTSIQNMDDITMFWVINVSFLNRVITNRIILLIPVQLKEIRSCFLENQREWRRQIQRTPVNRDIQII